MDGEEIQREREKERDKEKMHVEIRDTRRVKKREVRYKKMKKEID